MITNYLKQITLATIRTGCIALCIANQAQAGVLYRWFRNCWSWP
ncbi:hypothetical protein [Okeania sp. SIO3B5]|nr:hypothetical protein [Okeania sp. SIO3B5]